LLPMAGILVERAIEYGRFDVKQCLRASSCPAHLLLFAEPPVDQLM
jgi:hypothetical protein